MRTRSGIIAILAAAIVLATPAAAPTWAQQQRDHAVVLMEVEPADLLEGFRGDTIAEATVNETIYCHLIERDDQSKLVPMLAVKIPSLKDGDWQILPGKRMAITFKLRRGWKWHDGRAVTAADFVWTLRLRKNPRSPVSNRILDDMIESVLAPDPYTVTFLYNRLYPYADVGYYLLPSHVLLRELDRDPSQLDRSPYARAPIHCGPYRFKQWIPGVSIEVEASPETYGGESPRIRTIIFRFILDSNVLTANAIAEQGDVVAVGGLSLDQADEIAGRASRMRVHYYETLVYEYLGFNLDHEWLSDKRVRQAIGLAIDREGIVRSLFQGRHPVAHTFLPPQHFAHYPGVKHLTFEPNRARQLLTEAGFTRGPDEVLRDRAGRRLELTLMTTAGRADREQIQEIIKQHLKQVGIDVRIDNRPQSVFVSQVIRRRAFPHLVLHSFNWEPTSHGRNVWYSDQIPTPANNYVGGNFFGYRNPEVDRLLDAADEELDQGKRRVMLGRVQEILAEDLPTIPLFFRLGVAVSRRGLLNFKPSGQRNIPTWNVEQWAWSQ